MSARPEVVLVCGNKYAFRSVYVPVLRQLAPAALVRLILLDFPEEYDLRPVLDQLQADGALASYDLVPVIREPHAHFAAVGRISSALRREPPAALIVDEDSSPMNQLLIRAARAASVRVLGLQKEVPTRLLAAFEAAAGDPLVSLGEAYRRAGATEALRVPRRWLTGWIPARLRRGRDVRLKYWWLPLRHTGGWLNPSDEELLGITGQAACLRVDATIVYSERIAAALRRFFPGLKIVMAKHPLHENCRCNGGPRPPRLLITLGAPLRQCVGPENPAESIERRWEEAIAQAVSLNGFTSVDIRPHPRESDRYPFRLAERLAKRGIQARVTDTWSRSLPEVICEYAGVLGAPSGSLGEASIACRTAFVVALEAVERASFTRQVPYYAEGLVIRQDGNALRPEDFRRAPAPIPVGATVVEAVQGLLA